MQEIGRNIRLKKLLLLTQFHEKCRVLFTLGAKSCIVVDNV